MRFSKTLIFIILLAICFLPFLGVRAEDQCESREECEELLKKYERQIVQYEKDISKTAVEKKTLQNQIYSLKQGIKKFNI